MNYCTRYSIFSKETKQAVFENTNTACFAQFTNIDFPKNFPNCDFHPDRYLEVYLAVKNYTLYTPYTEQITELIYWWTKVLNDNLFPVTLSKRIFERKPKFTNDVYANAPAHMTKQEYYVWTFDFAEYSSKAHLKFALYFLRYIYEYTQYKIIEAAYKYCNKYPEANPLEVFGFMTMFDHDASIGHTITYTGNFVDYSIERIQEILDDFVKRKYDNTELQILQSKLRVKDPKKIYKLYEFEKLPDSLTKDTSWNKYKEIVDKFSGKDIIKKIKNEL